MVLNALQQLLEQAVEAMKIDISQYANAETVLLIVVLVFFLMVGAGIYFWYRSTGEDQNEVC